VKESLLTRLKERKLVQWALAYLAGAWVLLEATGFVSDRFAWPEVIVRALTILAGVGFFVVLVLAWYHGEKGRQRVSGPELLMLAALFIVAGVALSFVGPNPASVSEEENALPLPHADDDRPSVAALPFDNLSPDPDDAYFAAGVHEEILTHLARVAGLKVISRTSVLEYQDADKNLREIAGELGVNHILEGSVRRAGNRLRIAVQLIDALTDEHLWAGSYDRNLEDIPQAPSRALSPVCEETAVSPGGLANERVSRRGTGSPRVRGTDAW
jgi:serine/threonine-protein kinase